MVSGIGWRRVGRGSFDYGPLGEVPVVFGWSYHSGGTLVPCCVGSGGKSRAPSFAYQRYAKAVADPMCECDLVGPSGHAPWCLFTTTAINNTSACPIASDMHIGRSFLRFLGAAIVATTLGQTCAARKWSEHLTFDSEHHWRPLLLSQNVAYPNSAATRLTTQWRDAIDGVFCKQNGAFVTMQQVLANMSLAAGARFETQCKWVEMWMRGQTRKLDSSTAKGGYMYSAVVGQ